MKNFALIFALLCASFSMGAQGPAVSYYYDPATNLPWAGCSLLQDGGSQRKIPFLPVISDDRSPLGSHQYSNNIDVSGRFVFLGNGIEEGGDYHAFVGRKEDYSHGPMDLSGKIALMCYDFQDSIEARYGKDQPVSKRIAAAIHRGASAVVLFSHRKSYPFLYLPASRINTGTEMVPLITITEQSAISILESSGMAGEKMFREWEESGMPPESCVGISSLQLAMNCGFRKVETAHYLFRFRTGEFSGKQIREIARVNEKAYEFLTGHFSDLSIPEKKSLIVYYSGFDSKVFFTHHWGAGLMDQAGGMFMVHDQQIPGFGLAVHENMHNLWGTGSTSFMCEGIAMYAEALATDPLKNDRKTAVFLQENKLFPLREMITFWIGMPGEKTEIGYPASGSFVHFLVDSFGIESFREAFKLEARSDEEKEQQDTWVTAFHRSLPELESQWHTWLRNYL